MSTVELIAEQVKRLPADKQEEVLEFVRSLGQTRSPAGTPRNLYGIIKNMGPDITEEDIAETRREMWDTLVSR